jgi:hypothetical protein
VADGFDDISGSSLTLCSDHCSALTDTTEGFAQVSTAADEGDAVGVLLDVVGVVGRGEDFGLIDVVNTNGF